MTRSARTAMVVVIAAAAWGEGALSAEAQTTFADVSAAAGFSGLNASWAGVWADYNRDGFVDVLTTGHNQGITGSITQLWRNNGDGTFTDVTVAAGLDPQNRDPHGAAWADLNGDNFPDLYVAKGGGENELWRNNKNGTFTNVAATAGVTGFAIGHRGAYAVDYDRDRDLDLFVPGFSTVPGEGRNLLYQNAGRLTFTDVTVASGLAREELENRTAAWADYDKDGDLDVFLTIPCALFRNNGDGTFTEVTVAAGLTTSTACYNAAWGDYNNDALADLYINMRGGQQGILYRNNGDGTFTDVTVASGAVNVPIGGGQLNRALGITWGDYDNDGDLDLYVVNTNNAQQPNRLFRNNGDGTFADVAAEAGVGAQVAGQGSDATFVDYDNDGSLDLFVCNGGGNAVGPYLLFKNNGNGNSWLKIRLMARGSQSNRAAIGTKLWLVAGGVTQFREFTGQHYMGQDHVPVHFGLGSATVVDQLVITWPSGVVSTATNFRTNRTITVTEPLAP